MLSSAANASSVPVQVSGMLMLRRGGASPATGTNMHIFAEATRGEQPVTGLRVTALVHMPDGSSEEVVLMDNGAGRW